MRKVKKIHFREKNEDYIKGLIAGKYSLRQVSDFTNYTIQHLCHMKKRYKSEGSKVFINGHKGMKPSNAIPIERREKVVELYKAEEEPINFRFFRKLLEEESNIKLSYKTVYNILKSSGISSPEERHKKRKRIHRPRDRRADEGDMLQIDATPYQWFKWSGDNAYYSLHGIIDDATDKITGLCITEHECSSGYYDVLEQTIKNYGIPHEIYSDRAAIFCINRRNKEDLTVSDQLDGSSENKTQWQKVLDRFRIKQILAGSPQAKGRIERAWETIQKRLKRYFRRYKIKTLEEANRFLKEFFIKNFNKEFSVSCRGESVWREPESNWRDNICSRYSRKADSSGTISFGGCDFTISGDDCANVEVEVCLFRDRIEACVNGELRSLTLVSDPNNMNDTVSDEQKEIIKKYLLSDGKKSCA